MQREVIRTDKAPKGIGAYEQALKLGGWVITSGQIPLNAQTGALVEGGIRFSIADVPSFLEARVPAGRPYLMATALTCLTSVQPWITLTIPS